jgi:ligand-binding sensor protein
VQPIQDTFADALGIMVIITDLDGNPVTEVSNPCGLFTVISAQPDALRKCLENWRTMAHTIDLEPKFIPSHLGLLCSRAMIRVGHELKGMVFVGGVAPENWPPSEDQLNKIAAEFGVSPELMAPHMDEVFYMSSNEQAHVLPFVQRIANIVAHIINERKDFVGKLDAIAQLTR